jgi:hypothetical protein
MGMGTIVVAAAIAATLAISGTAAGAEAMSRDQYVPQLEAICKPGAEATRRAMEGVRDDVRDPDRIPIAARKFDTAANTFGSTIAEIAKVPRPAADLSRLKEWFTYLNRQEEYLVRIAAQLRHDHTIKAQRLTARFIHNGNLANNVTLAFGFYYCSFKFSRYG